MCSLELNIIAFVVLNIWRSSRVSGFIRNNPVQKEAIGFYHRIGNLYMHWMNHETPSQLSTLWYSVQRSAGERTAYGSSTDRSSQPNCGWWRLNTARPTRPNESSQPARTLGHVDSSATTAIAVTLLSMALIDLSLDGSINRPGITCSPV